MISLVRSKSSPNDIALTELLSQRERAPLCLALLVRAIRRLMKWLRAGVIHLIDLLPTSSGLEAIRGSYMPALPISVSQPKVRVAACFRDQSSCVGVQLLRLQ